MKEIMATQEKKLYEMGIVDASFVGLDSTPVAANTKQNNPKSFTFTKEKFNPGKQPKADPDCALGPTRPPTSTMSGGMSSTGVIKAMCWWTASPGCRSMS